MADDLKSTNELYSRLKKAVEEEVLRVICALTHCDEPYFAL